MDADGWALLSLLVEHVEEGLFPRRPHALRFRVFGVQGL